MSPRIFLTWFVVTVVTVVMAVVVGLGHETASFDLVKREPVFEDLRENPDSPAKVEVKSRFGEFTLQRGDTGWVAPDRADYPVEEADVRRLIVGLADMRFVERKTANPERFKRLEVQEITDELSDSAYVKVSDASGKSLAEVIIGRPSARFFAGNSSGTYIRFPETTDTWLVTSVTNVQTRLIPWLDRDIVSVGADRIARIAIGTGEEGYVLSRVEAGAEFTIEGAPEGRSLDQEKVRPVNRALADVELEDVKQRSAFSLPQDAKVAEVVTFGGLSVRARLANVDKKNWATFEASYVGDATDSSDAANAAREAAKVINARVGNWVYWLPSNTFTNLTRPVDEVLAPAAPDAS
ncbi:MAG: DUF4340 domain-containing protein [Alphaproteobacteria bacterium]|nr:DUF4340 domain-containing protein [Alphaproteobacteria bacterium]